MWKVFNVSLSFVSFNYFCLLIWFYLRKSFFLSLRLRMHEFCFLRKLNFFSMISHFCESHFGWRWVRDVIFHCCFFNLKFLLLIKWRFFDFSWIWVHSILLEKDYLKLKFDFGWLISKMQVVSIQLKAFDSKVLHVLEEKNVKPMSWWRILYKFLNRKNVPHIM